MGILLVALAIILVSGLLSLLLQRSYSVSTGLAVVGTIIGCVVGLVPAISTVIKGNSEVLHWAWSVPGGTFAAGIDPLSALFLFILCFVSIPSCIYGHAYVRPYRTDHNLAVTWFFTCVLIVSMALVIIARNGVLFLVAWEVMSLSSFFLVMFDSGQLSVRRAGFTYLVATHVGTAVLIAMFVLLGQNGSLDFEQSSPAGHAGLLFILCLIGFGTKAGFVPLHVWLPEAHPAAPSHISALMSGVMIKMGIYGIVRILTFLGPPQAWWGWALLGIGVTSGVLGVLFALVQHDLKRLLAYHSVENIGIIAIGLGIGLLGLSFNSPLIAVLGFGGGLLHVINHSLFKALLFLGAGSVAHATGTRELDKLGGLLRRMPWTALAFLIGSIAICGLPPLNGFVSEFLIYLGALNGGTVRDANMAVAGILALAGLALIGGLAVACFTKAFGVVFLGEPRKKLDKEIHEATPAMTVSMLLLATACVAIGLLAPLAVKALGPAVSILAQIPSESIDKLIAQGTGPLSIVVVSCLTLVGIVILLRVILPRRKTARETVTWDCGYASPTPRMQYTAASFVLPITSLFHRVLRTHRVAEKPDGLFPISASIETHTPDLFQERLFRPILAGTERALEAFRWLQHGNVHLYVLYILITLLVLMFWKLQ